jgi:hypothetical protein
MTRHTNGVRIIIELYVPRFILHICYWIFQTANAPSFYLIDAKPQRVTTNERYVDDTLKFEISPQLQSTKNMKKICQQNTTASLGQLSRILFPRG